MRERGRDRERDLNDRSIFSLDSLKVCTLRGDCIGGARLESVCRPFDSSGSSSTSGNGLTAHNGNVQQQIHGNGLSTVCGIIQLFQYLLRSSLRQPAGHLHPPQTPTAPTAPTAPDTPSSPAYCTALACHNMPAFSWWSAYPLPPPR